jgi:hypothetical protein
MLSYYDGMNQAQSRLRNLIDEELPALPVMLGPDAGDLLGVAVTSAGGRLISARPRQVQWQPGRALTVVYDARLASAQQSAIQTSLVAITGAHIPTSAMVLEQGASRVGVWTLAEDPSLPGLAIALDAERMRDLLDDLGSPPAALQVKLRAYRPGRRGVVEVQAGPTRLFVKVVMPAKVAALQRRHALLSECLPVPHSHGWSEEFGLVILEAMPGSTLRDVLSQKRAPLPDTRQIAAMLDRIPAPGDGRRPPDVLGSLAMHSELLGRLLPELRPRLESLSACLADETNAGPLVPVHGDLHEAQLMVLDTKITGLIDVDTVGLGHRVDDWAHMIGHLATRLEAAPRAIRPRIQEYGRQIVAIADSQVDPTALRRRVAAVILALATGPFRVQTRAWPSETRQRVALAERWCESARSTPPRKSAMGSLEQKREV